MQNVSINVININNLPSSLLIFCHNLFLSTHDLVIPILCRWWKRPRLGLCTASCLWISIR